jgi:hypothetical protein
MSAPSIKKPKNNPQQRARKAVAPESHRNRDLGEGNYKAAREYDQAAAAFAKSGKVEAAAAAAKPKNAAEAAEMVDAEARGRSKRRN